MNNGNDGLGRENGNGEENKDIKGLGDISLPENAEDNGADVNTDVEKREETVAEETAASEGISSEADVDKTAPCLENGQSQASGSPNEKAAENGRERESEPLDGKGAENGDMTESGRADRSECGTANAPRNMAEILNSYLFDTDGAKRHGTSKVDPERLKALWKRVGVIVLVATVAFFGSFACMFYVCRTALLGDSDFFATLMLKNSGVTVNRIETDMISGSYIEDTTELAEKISECSAAIRVYGDEGVVGSGSAVILSEDGLAVTNYHVAYGHERSLKAELCDGTRCDVKVLHLDKLSDIAIIEIKSGKKLTPATFGDSEKAKAGQSIAICGNPLGLEFSVSFGKISHPDRDLGDAVGNYIQLDASVNPGNSGGGLFDAAGNLIGIVNAKADGTSVDGIGYAIPSARVITVMNDLLEYGYVRGRPAIGLSLVQVTSSNWDYFKNGADGNGEGELYGSLYENKYGIYIFSSQYTAELQKGDRIVSGGGRTFTDRDDFSEWLLNFKPGDTVKITVERAKAENQGGELIITREVIEADCTLYERDWIDKPSYEKSE